MVATVDPDGTRSKLVEAAFEEFWTKGYNGTRVDEIVEKTSFTKGAFYHYFPSKKALAHAVIDEIIGGMLQKRWVEPLQNAADPIAAILSRLQELTTSNTEAGIRCGCPLNNIAQELSAVDEDIRAQVQGYFEIWIASIAGALTQAQVQGQITTEIDPVQIATQIVATFEGGVSLAKACRNEAPLNGALDGLVRYLEYLRHVENPTPHSTNYRSSSAGVSGPGPPAT